MTTEPVCPAETYGRLGACRTCVKTGGGPGKQCAAWQRVWEKERDEMVRGEQKPVSQITK